MGPKEKRAALIAEAKAIAEGAKKDGRDALTPEESGKVEANLKEAGELASQVMAAQKSGELLDQLKHAEGVNLEVGEKGEQTEGSAAAQQGGVKTLGQTFIESAGFKAFQQRYPSGVPEHVTPQLDPVNIGGVKELIEGSKTLLNVGTNTTASGNALPMVLPDNRGLIAPLFDPLTILDFINRGATDSDTVEYFREISRTNNAATVAEATATGSTSGTKPESAFRYEKITAAVRTIATWIPATRKALSDVSQLRTLIDTYLRQMVLEELRDQVLNGDGTGENLNGLNTVAAANAVQAFDTDTFVGARRALATMRGNFQSPTAVVMNPADVVAIDLAQDNNGAYVAGGPFRLGLRTLWGVPVIEEAAQPTGLALIGDFRQAILYDREQLNVMTGTINDQFIRNMVTFLAELRATLVVLRANAFMQVDVAA